MVKDGERGRRREQHRGTRAGRHAAGRRQTARRQSPSGSPVLGQLGSGAKMIDHGHEDG